MSRGKFIIIDCGTTNLRVKLLDETGQIIYCTERPGGVRHTAIDGHNGKLKHMLREAIAEILDKTGLTEKNIARCIASGMITSNVGLLEIPHLVAPVSAEDLHAGMQKKIFPEIASFEIEFIPGVRNFAGQVTTDNCATMDMMRGEEVETIGLYELLNPGGECVFILPGSHNKFVNVDAQGRILGCMTSISGELLDAITHHSILADTVKRDFASEKDYDLKMAQMGARECVRCGLGRAAFAGRILNQLGGVPSVKLRSYLLGAVLSQDIMALRAFAREGVQVYIAGKMPLQSALKDIMLAMGWDAAQVLQVPKEFTTQMGTRGVMKIAGI